MSYRSAWCTSMIWNYALSASMIIISSCSSLLPRPQLVFEWSTPASNLSGARTDKTDVFHLTSDDEGEDWGEDEDSQEVTSTTVPVAIVRRFSRVCVILARKRSRWLKIRKCVHQISTKTCKVVFL